MKTYFPFTLANPRRTSTLFVIVALSLISFGCLGPNGLPAYKAEHRLHRTASAAGITRINVVAKTADITIEGYDGADVEIKALATASASFADRAQELVDLIRLSAEKENNTLKISPILPELFDPRCLKIELRVQIPWPMLAATQPATQPAAPRLLNVRTQTGPITITGIQAQINAISDTGNLTLRRSAGQITLRTDTGSIVVDAVQGRLSARSDTGNIDLTAFSGILDASSDTGTVTYATPQGPRTGKTIKGDTATGKITLIRRTPDNK